MPAYNSACHITSVFSRMPQTAWRAIRSVWIINDGSTDATKELIENLETKYDVIHPIHLLKNSGYGNAVRLGLEKCKNEGCAYVCCLHSDGQYPPEAIPQFLSEMAYGGCDILQGSRIASGTARAGGMPLYKLIAGKILTFCENRVFGLDLTDYHSGFLFYNKKALDMIPFEKLSGSFDFDLEIIASARAAGLKVDELSIPTRYGDEKSNLNPITYGFRVLGVMIRYIMGRYAFGPYTDLFHNS
jgi:glycosyltransferase involved in cell wall biosynthesis